MPRLSDTMEEGTVAKWFKKVGDQVSEGDILAEIETDKATMEFESFNEGELLHIGIQEGGTAPVDTLLAIIGDKGEDISALLSGGDVTTSEPEEAKVVAPSADTGASSETVAMPEGAEVITMPRLSDTMEEGTVAKWNIKVGDTVNEGDILAEIETDKATMEFESFYQGELLHIGLQEGESAPVDSVLAVIGKAGTDPSLVAAALASSSEPPIKQEATPLPEPEPVPTKAEAVSEVETVANDLNETTSEIDTVANNITNVNTVGTNIANVNNVGNDIANVKYYDTSYPSIIAKDHIFGVQFHIEKSKKSGLKIIQNFLKI